MWGPRDGDITGGYGNAHQQNLLAVYVKVNGAGRNDDDNLVSRAH
jgi:hypothetical protein